MRPHSLRVSLALAAALAAAPAARAQCPAWILSPCEHAPFHTTDPYATAVFTPPGSAIPRIVTSGRIQSYNSADLHGLAQWDGSNWTTLGGGTDADVYALAPWNSPTGPQLVVAGDFSLLAGSITAYSIASWDGSTWHTLGAGADPDDGIGVVGTWDPDGAGPASQAVVAVGGFTQIGGVAALHIAYFDGSAWHPMGSGIPNGGVGALTTWTPAGANPNVIAVGSFAVAGGITCNGIARWDGSWHPMGTGLQAPSGVNVVTAINWDPDGPGALAPVLVVGGNFTSASGTPAYGVAYWDGSWHAMNTPAGTVIWGLGTWDPDGSGPEFAQLVASGTFGDDPTQPDTRMWNGSSWQPMGTAHHYLLQEMTTWDPDGPGPQAPQLIGQSVGREVTITGVADGVIRWDGANWSTLNSAPQIYAAAVLGSRLMAGGQFEMESGYIDADAFNLTYWAGGTGAFGNPTGPVRALKVYSRIGGNELVAGGSFGAVAGLSAANIAQYSDVINIAQQGWSAMGQGLNATVYAIERFNNFTYAAGAFTGSGATTLNHIARFDGTNWQPLGSGATQGVNGTVNALKTFGSYLYAGGSFTSAGGLSSGGLARWDGTNWSIVGGNFSGTVNTLEVYNNSLIIGGQYPGIGGSPNIARYDGSNYFTLGSGGTNAQVRALCVGPDGLLYMGGDFSLAGANTAHYLSRWDGTTWSDVAGGTDGPVYALAAYRNEVHAFGTFGKCAFSTMAAPAWARFSTDGVPWYSVQPPSNFALCVGQTTDLFAALVEGYSATSTYWQHNGSTLSTGYTPWGTQIAVYPNQLFLGNVQPQDRGSYDLVSVNDCATVISTVCVLAINSADFNGDGAVGTDADIEAFFACLAGNCCPTCGSADFNADGSVGTDADIEAFFRVLGGGHC
jgi:hypothetical protein